MKKLVNLSVVAVLVSFILISCNEKGSNGQANESAKKSNAKAEIIHLTKEEFLLKVVNYEANPNEWKYLGDKPAIVDFYATWCGPCKVLAPILEELYKEYNGQIVIYKVDVDKERDLANEFNITSIPTLLFIPKEGEPQITSGAPSKSDLKNKIDVFLLKK